MNFLAAVNRVLRDNNVISSDDDDLMSFTGTQHVTTRNHAVRAIKLEVIDLVSDRTIPSEVKKNGSITTVIDTRTYDLPTNFSRFYGKHPFLRPSDTNNDYLYEYKGGYDSLRQNYTTWDTQTGRPEWWYEEENSNEPRQIGLYPVPSTVLTYSFDYEAQTMPTSETDELPFQTSEQDEVFVAMASERWKVLAEKIQIQRMEDNPVWSSSKAALLHLIRPTQASNRYGRKYA